MIRTPGLKFAGFGFKPTEEVCSSRIGNKHVDFEAECRNVNRLRKVGNFDIISSDE